MKNKKILIYSLIVFILAGMIVILLKGFNVDLMIRNHDSIEYIIGKDFKLKEVKQIAKEQLNGKNVKIRTIEVFNDAVSINSLEITEEEKNNIVSKLNEKYSNQVENSEIKIISNPGLRLRQIVKPYILPTIISIVLIYGTYCIRFYKYAAFNWKKILESISVIIFVNLFLVSLIAITRIPFNTITIPILIFATIFSIIAYFSSQKNNISKQLRITEK